MSGRIGDYRVVLAFDVTAPDFDVAAINGIDDMREALDGTLPGCVVEVTDYESGETRTIEIVDGAMA